MRAPSRSDRGRARCARGWASTPVTPRAGYRPVLRAVRQATSTAATIAGRATRTEAASASIPAAPSQGTPAREQRREIGELSVEPSGRVGAQVVRPQPVARLDPVEARVKVRGPQVARRSVDLVEEIHRGTRVDRSRSVVPPTANRAAAPPRAGEPRRARRVRVVLRVPTKGRPRPRRVRRRRPDARPTPYAAGQASPASYACARLTAGAAKDSRRRTAADFMLTEPDERRPVMELLARVFADRAGMRAVRVPEGVARRTVCVPPTFAELSAQLAADDRDE